MQNSAFDNMLNFQRFDKDPMSKMDLRIVFLILGLVVSLAIAFIADHGLYVKKPDLWIHSMITYIAVLGHTITGDRLFTFIFSTCISFVVIMVIGFFIFHLAEIYLIEPMMIRRKLAIIKREKKLVNKLDDGTF